MSILILGCGMAGLGAGLALQEREVEFEIWEREAAPGGLAQTDLVYGFAFDRTGHFLHFNSPDVKSYYKNHGLAFDAIQRQAAVLFGERVVPYPFQYNLWALDSSLRRRALADLTRARASRPLTPHTFADVVRSTWGETLTDIFFRPYNEKLWGRTLEALPPDCAGRYMPAVNIALAEEGSKQALTTLGYNTTFFYPRSGRIGDLARLLAVPLGPRIRLEQSGVKIDMEARACYGLDGQCTPYDGLISTVPLPTFLTMLDGCTFPAELLEFTGVLNVRVGFRGRMRCPFHWLYVPDRELPFYRIGFPRNVNAKTCPPECASVSIEYTLGGTDPGLTPASIAASALAYLARMGLIEVDECLFVDTAKISPAYVVFRSAEREAFVSLTRWLEDRGIYLAGRFGSWDYLSMEEAFQSGQTAAASLCLSAPAQSRRKMLP